MTFTLRCHERFHLGDRKGLSRHLYVVEHGQIVPQYELMCSAIDDSIDALYLAAVLEDIEQVETKQSARIEEETEGWLYWLTPAGVSFESKFGEGAGGHVSLAQFKLAVETYLRFLQDPQRKPIEVVFPDS